MSENYQPVNFPFNLYKNQQNLSGSEIDTFFRWFLEVKNERLAMINMELFSSHKTGFSKQKLLAIQYWMRNNLVVSHKSEDEIMRERAHLPEKIRSIHKIPKYSFITPSFSVCFDAGIYFAEFIKTEINGLGWDIQRDNKFAQFGYPFLFKPRNKARLYPYWIMLILAKQIIEDRASEDRILSLFRTWRTLFSK